MLISSSFWQSSGRANGTPFSHHSILSIDQLRFGVVYWQKYILFSRTYLFKGSLKDLIAFEIIQLQRIITLCMKLSWFCHTNSGQLFCNCPLFVIALVPGLLFGGKPDETCCHSVVASKWLKTRVSQFALQDEILQLKHRQRLLRVWQFNVSRSWKSNVFTTSN